MFNVVRGRIYGRVRPELSALVANKASNRVSGLVWYEVRDRIYYPVSRQVRDRVSNWITPQAALVNYV